MSEPETRGCWYKPYAGGTKDKWTAGEFHQWGTELSTMEGEGNFTVAVVEDSRSHAVVTVTPERVHFGADPDE